MEVCLSSLLWYGVLGLLPLLVLFIHRKKNARFNELLAKLPGPKGLPVIGVVHHLMVPRDEVFNVFQGLTIKYGPIFLTQIGPRRSIVHLMDPKDIEVILSSNKLVRKGSGYKFLRPWLGDGLLVSIGKKWQMHRKLLTPSFHFKILENFQEVFAENSQILVEMLRKEINSQKFDVSPYLARCALDIICETAMGTKINAQSDTDSTYVKAVNNVAEIAVHRARRFWLSNDFIFNLTALGRKQTEYLKTVHNFSDKIIEERIKEYKLAKLNRSESVDEDAALGMKKKMAFLDMLLKASEGEKKLTNEELRDEVNGFMFAGHDTTATTMSWFLFLVGTYPEIQDKVAQELDEIFGDSDRTATTQDLGNMKYLERCIKETMRLYPTVPFIGRYLEEDLKTEKYTIPAGAEINIHIYRMHHNPVIYPEPDKYDPDRFLPERIQGRHPYSYIPFSAGPRNCVGQRFGMQEMKTLLSMVIRNFRIEAVDQRKDLKLRGELVMRPAQGLRIRISERKSTK